MHRVLQIPEVVHIIIQFVFPGYLWFVPSVNRTRTRTLLNVALTCRAFSGFALDELWYYMTSLKPLFELLPNLQSSNSSKLVDGLLWGPISKTDLSTVQKYASRIRYYESNRIDDHISVFAYMHLLRACGHPCLLPNLTYLKLDTDLTGHANFTDTTSKIISLISPSLHEVHMDATASSLLPILNSLQTHASNVAILKIGTALFNSHFMSAICSFPQLQEVLIKVYNSDDSEPPSLDIDFFTRISFTQTLRRFSLSGEIKLVSTNAKFGRGTVEFPALESLNLNCLLTSISPIATLLHYVALPSLEWLSLAISSNSIKPIKSIEARYWDEFFDLIGSVTTNSFTSLKISHHSFGDLATLYSHWKDVDLTVSKFPNLDKLSLEDFIIETPILHSLHRNDVQKIINTWPGLQCLRLTSCRPFKLGFDALLDIALGLPHLTQSMNIQRLPPLEKIPLLGHGLDHLELEISSMLPDIMDFAQTVDKIFPKLDSWNFDCSDCLDFHGQATSLLSMLRRARRYEAQRASLGITAVNFD